ncbi:MAG: hypothetical protein Q8L27_00150, partial [archaeon]|nr:hypothetical protein [archaeon]
RCKNFAGQVNDAEFAVKVIVAPGPDLSPPYIKGFSPLDKSYLHKDANSTNMILYVDEPSECRYSTEVNSGFEDMTNNLSCMTDLSYAKLGNLPCFTILNNLNVGENKFYFKCKDKPDSEERKVTEQRITNENAKEYTLKVCSKGLEITSLSPSEKIVSSKSPVEIKLEVETSGCVNGGESTCYYQFGEDNKIAFLNTGGLKHSQTLKNMPAGNQKITITCEDVAGTSAEKSINAKIELDNSAPKILRFFNDNDKLRIITNENAVCKYSKDKNIGCSFDFNEGSAMLDDGKTHLALWERNTNYYIKCEDSFGNQNLNCGTIIKTY